MGLLKSGALLGIGAAAMHQMDKNKYRQAQYAPAPPQGYAPEQNSRSISGGQNQDYYYQPQQQQQPQYYRQDSGQRQLPYQSSSHGKYMYEEREPSYARAIESGGYVHQSFCNGTCGERCNGLTEQPPMYSQDDRSKSEFARDYKNI